MLKPYLMLPEKTIMPTPEWYKGRGDSTPSFACEPITVVQPPEARIYLLLTKDKERC